MVTELEDNSSLSLLPTLYDGWVLPFFETKIFIWTVPLSGV